MSKIYNALELARQELQEVKGIPLAHDIGDLSQSKGHNLIDMEDEMIHLYQNITSLLPELPKKIIQFIGSSSGEGTSTVIRQFASVTASILGKPVLLLDSKTQSCHSSFFGITPKSGVADVMRNGKPINSVLHQVGNSKLFMGQFSLNGDYVTSIFGSPKLENTFKELMQTFEFILIDSPAADTSSDVLAISRMVHGVVLVVEAEHTKWQKIKAVKEKITKNGGNILGVILNKRKHYIPEFIYKRL
ncbi:MAG: CpsD/CapB family tyrosine-protein kinase [Planctomycetes bacterium]|nr:CpsD/CapB family tyrosine-protein kinase [Planctomycetota bacterium]